MLVALPEPVTRCVQSTFEGGLTDFPQSAYGKNRHLSAVAQQESQVGTEGRMVGTRKENAALWSCERSRERARCPITLRGPFEFCMLRVSRYTWDPDKPSGEIIPLFGSAPQHQDVSLRSVGKTLWRRKWLILLVILVCVGLAALASKVLPKQYMAEAQILFTQETPSPTGVNEDPDAPPRNETIGTQVSMLLTRSMSERAAAAIQKSADKVGLKLGEKDVDPDELRTRIRIDNPEKTDLITLSIEAENPEKAALLANNYCKAFVAWKKGIAEEKARTFTNSLSARLEAAKDELRLAQGKLLAYQQSNEVQDLSEQTKSLIEDYSKRLSDQGDLDRDTTAAEEQLGQISALAKNQTNGLKISHWIRDDNLILGLQKDLSDAEVERAHNAIKYKEGYPGVFEPIDARITDLKGRIRDVVDHTVGVDVPNLASQADAVNQYRRALVDTTYVRAKQNANKRVLAHIKTHLDKLPELQRTFANLSRDAEAAASRVSLLQGRYASAKAGVPSAQSNVSFVGIATPPKKVSRPRLGVNLVLGLLVGVFMATLVALYAEGRRPSIADAEQLRSLSTLPVVPLNATRKPWNGRGDTSEETLELCAFVGSLQSGGSNGSIILAHALAGSDSESPGSEITRGFSHLGRKVLLMRFASPASLRFVEPSSTSEILAGASHGEPRVVDMPCLTDARHAGLSQAELAALLTRCRALYDVIVLSVCPAEEGPDYLVARPLCDLQLVFVQFGAGLISEFQALQERVTAIKSGPCYVVGRELRRVKKNRRGQRISMLSEAQDSETLGNQSRSESRGDDNESAM